LIEISEFCSIHSGRGTIITRPCGYCGGPVGYCF